MLAENGGEAVVLLLLVTGRDGLEVAESVFVLPDVVGQDGFFKDAARGEIVFVSVPPDGMAVFDVCGDFEGAEVGIRSEIFFVVAVGDDVARVAKGAVFDEGGVEAQELSLADLLGIAEKLVAIAQGGIPSTVELAAGGLALDDEEGLGEIVGDKNVRPPAAGAMAEFPFGFQLNVAGEVAFLQEPVHAFENDEVFQSEKITGLALVDLKSLIFWVMESLIRGVHRQSRWADGFSEDLPLFGKTELRKELNEAIK